MLDDVCEVFNIVLLKLGKNLNIIDFEEIKVVYEELKKLCLNVFLFSFDNFVNLFIFGEVFVG